MSGATPQFRLALGLALASGCAALAHQLLWTRRLIDLLGASAASSTRVFSCFFLGLALGAVVTPPLVRRLRRPWRAIALVEFGVALLALPALTLPHWSGWIWPALGSEGLIGWPGATVKLLLSAIVVFPPAFCMGMVLPLMARAVLHDRFDLARHGVWLYAVNTLGGVLGLGGVSVITLHLVGAEGSMLLAIGLNLLVGGGCWLLSLRSPPLPVVAPSPSERPAVERRVRGSVYAIAMVSGMGILAFEVLALQLLALSAPLSFYAPTAVLTVVILLLGLAALIAPELIRRGGGAQRVLAIGLSGAALCAAAAPLWFFQLVQWIDLGRRDTLVAYLAVLVSTTLIALGPAVLLAGLVFPSVLAWFGTEGGDRYGRGWGWLLAVNGLGGWVGAEVTYRYVLPAVGVHQGIGIVAILYAVAALACAWLRRPRSAGTRVWSSVAAAVVAMVMLGPLAWLTHLNPTGVIIIHEQTGREGTVAVVDSPHMGRRIIMANQYVLGGTKFRYDQERLTHLPLMLHPDPRQVACIGLGTGITPGAALAHRTVDSITAVELSPLVVGAADLFFGQYNHEMTRSERARVVVEDARTYLAASPGQFDVVVGDLLLPWAAGEARLYSLEHFRSVRDSLKAGGIFCQWLAAYQVTPEHFDMIRDTFCRVFPQAYLFRNTWNSAYPAIALVGMRDSRLHWSTVAARCAAVRNSGDLGDPLMRHAEGVGMLYLGTTGDGGGPLHTLSNMRLELAAGRVRVAGRQEAPYLAGEHWLQFVQDRCLLSWRNGSQQSAESPALDLVSLAWLAQRLTIWETLRQHAGPIAAEDQAQLPALLERIARDFPPAIRRDEEADWSRWPGDTTPVFAEP